MTTSVRDDLLAAGLFVFDRVGFEAATVAAIRARARASNGSFFHVFGSKKELAGALFLEVLRHYHAAVLAALDPMPRAGQGIDRLIRAHLDWVVSSRREARYLFEISRSEWSEDVRDAQRAQNARLARRHRALARAVGCRRRALADDAGDVRQPAHRPCPDLLPRLSLGT
ncbi:AcrR family transcriptional regulator [Bradyrhizobium sp. i1.3.1]